MHSQDSQLSVDPKTPNEFSSSYNNASVVNLPQRPLQAYLHRYPPTQSTNTTPDNSLQNAGHFSSFSDAIRQPVNIVANAALQAAVSSAATDFVIPPRIAGGDGPVAENLPLPVTAVENDTMDNVSSTAAQVLFLLAVGSIIVIRVLA